MTVVDAASAAEEASVEAEEIAGEEKEAGMDAEEGEREIEEEDDDEISNYIFDEIKVRLSQIWIVKLFKLFCHNKLRNYHGKRRPSTFHQILTQKHDMLIISYLK